MLNLRLKSGPQKTFHGKKTGDTHEYFFKKKSEKKKLYIYIYIYIYFLTCIYNIFEKNFNGNRIEVSSDKNDNRNVTIDFLL